MNHSFDVEIAKEYGMLGAVLINHIMFWTEKNRANRRNFFDGRYWIYNSSKAFSELFPYVSAWTINSTLNKLVEAGILIKGNYNTTPMDRTLWFALSDKGLELVKTQKCIFANPKMEICDSKNGNLQMQKCLNTDINTDNKTDINTDILSSKDDMCFAPIISAWNALPVGISRVNKIVKDSNRDRMLTKRIRDYSVDSVLAAIDNIKQSKFLQGENNRGWIITFDWFIKPQNFQKVLEGNYTDRKQIRNDNDRVRDELAEWMEEVTI